MLHLLLPLDQSPSPPPDHRPAHAVPPVLRARRQLGREQAVRVATRACSRGSRHPLQLNLMVVQHCSVHSTQSVNTGGALAANKSARAMLGPLDTALLHVCGPPRPGVANRPSSGACCVGLGQGQRGAHRRGSRGQRSVTYQQTRLIKPRPALACDEGPNCRARIAGPSITHSSTNAWRSVLGWAAVFRAGTNLLRSSRE
jgi:hypothetical protein